MPAICFLADEDFDRRIVAGVLRRLPELDLVTEQDVGLAGRPDAAVLEWAARDGRIVLTNDVNTLIATAYARLTAGAATPGVFAVAQSLSFAEAIEEILLIAECSTPLEWEGQVRFLPL